MRVLLTLRPGQKGTQRLVDQYGDRLICVRYRYDVVQLKRYKTVEVIVEETDWTPSHNRPYSPNKMMSLQVAWGEREVAEAIKAAGGRWNTNTRVWRLRYAAVEALGLVDRIVSPDV
jgi:hypothetical protein